MQRMPPNMPPRQNNQNGTGAAVSPALNMARRIRSEQGAEQARQYLLDMEPYLAPAERAHIAEQLGVALPPRQERTQAAPTPPMGGGMPMGGNPLSALGAMGGNPLAALGAMGGNAGGANPMQLIQMLSGMQGGGAGNAGASGAPAGMGGMGNIMQMAQMMQTLGPLLGGKK